MIQFERDYDEEIAVSKVMVEYTQKGDCCQDKDEYQTLRLETEDGGGGPFIRMSLPQGGFWSFDNIENLKEIIKDFSEKVNYFEKKEDKEPQSFV